MTIFRGVTQVCSVCESSFLLSRKEYKLVHSDFPLFCGGVCLITRIKEKTRSLPILHPVPTRMRYVPGGFRSKMEGWVYNYLTYKGLKLKHEPGSIRLLDGSRYVPDFLVEEWNCLLEVKGLWHPGARRKLSDARVACPDIELILIPSYLPGKFLELPMGLKKEVGHVK